MRRFTTSSISISFTTSHQSAAASVVPLSWWSTRPSGKDASRVHRICQGESGQAPYGSGGIGGITHITAELFKELAGPLDILHAPYRGVAPALTDLLGGQVHVVFVNLAPSIEYIRAGKLRALAITTTTGSDALPDIPTVDEFVPGYEASTLFGLGAPKNTPAEIIDKLNKEINAGLADPKMKARLADLDGTVLGGSPADFGKLIAKEIEKWGKVIRAANIRPE